MKSRVFSMALAAALLLSATLPAMAADTVFFTLTAKSTYLYNAPSTSAARVYSMFQGQTYGVLARNGAGTWLRLNFPGASQEAWVQASFGTVAGDLNSLPVSEGNPAPAAAPTQAAVVTTASNTASPGGATAVIPNLKFTITAKSTYVRNGPGTGYGRVLSAFQGQSFSVIGRSSDAGWIKVVLTGGPSEAWLSVGVGALSGNTQVISLPVAAVGAAPASASPTTTTASTTSGPKPSTVSVRPGAGGGFELGGQVAGFDYPHLMQYAGMTWVKRQVRWGPGSAADAGLINDAHAKGFKVLLSVLGDPNSLRGGANYDEFARFVGDLARYGADGIEVWNEMNIDREWPSGEINPASYVELLRRAYASIKANNPNTLVVSGAPAPTGYFGGCSPIGCDDAPYIQGMVNAGALNYLDCIGIHYNEGVVSPFQSSGDPRGNPNHYTRYYQTMVDTYYNAGGGARKLCFTELGYLSGEEWGYVPGGYLWKGTYNLTVGEQALFLGQATQLSRDQGKVRLLIIFNVDLRHWGSDPQAGYAIVRPNGGCPACDSLRAVTGGR